MPRTIITGAAGFTGRYLVGRLAAEGHEVHALVHEPADGLEHCRAVHSGNLLDLGGLRDMVRAVQPQHVVHLAAIAHVHHGDVSELYQTNVIGTRNLLESLAGEGRGMVSVLLASSALVYDQSEGGVLDEQSRLQPANDYGVSKLASEHIAGLYAESLPITIVRSFNYTGPGQAQSFLIPKIVKHVRERAKVIELGNVDVSRDFSDVRTVVEGYARLLATPDAVGKTVNMASGRSVSLSEVLAMVSRLSGHDMEVRVNPAFVRANEVPLLIGSRARLEELVGSLPDIAFEETLRWMLEAPL
jgi:nucleoside-diphosphate-sugar epimerase